MLTSKYFKVKFQFSEFISGLEKGMSPTGKQVSQIHMPIETTHSRFRQSTKGKNIWSSFFSELKSPIFQNHNFSSASSQVSFAVTMPGSLESHGKCWYWRIPFTGLKHCPRYFSMTIATLDIEQQCL